MTRFDRTPGRFAAESGAGKNVRFFNAVNPTDEEILRLSDSLNVGSEFIHAALDMERGPRAEATDNGVLVACAAPLAFRQGESMRFEVFPLSLILSRQAAAVIGGRASSVAEEWVQGCGTSAGQGGKPALLLMQLLATRFQRHLRQIEKMMTYLEKQSAGAPCNRKLQELLELETALVHYSAALRDNEVLVEKIVRGRFFSVTEEERLLFERVCAEFRRAGNLADAYARLLEGTIGTLSSMVSNSLNRMLRVFSVVAIVLALTLVGLSIYATYVPGFSSVSVGLVLALSVVCLGCGGLALYQAHRGSRVR